MKSYKTPDWLTRRYGVFLVAKRTETPRVFQKLGTYTTFWKAWNTAGTILLTFLMIASALLIGAFTAVTFFPVPATHFVQPSNLILIPGMGNTIRVVVASPYVLAAFVVGVWFHELGHGVAAISEGYEVKEWGILFFLFFPVGAYVKSETGVTQSTRDFFSFCRFMSAGVMNNLFLGMVGHTLFQLTTTASFESTYLYYFGSLLNHQPTVAIGDVGLLATIGFWLFIVNINLAILNSLPLFMLDGGRVVSNAVLQATETLKVKERTSMALLVAIDVLIGLGLILIIFKPKLF